VSNVVLDVIAVDDDSDASIIVGQLLDQSRGDFVLVKRAGVVVSDEAVSMMLRALDGPMAATASPVPTPVAPPDAVVCVILDERLPPPASLVAPCLHAMVASRNALLSLPRPDLDPGVSATDAIGTICRLLVETGWRHVSAAGVALAWEPADVGTLPQVRASWADLANQVAGPANEGLSTHVLWSEYSLRSPRIVVDGACLSDMLHNGSQNVVLNITQALKDVRPGASVTLAVRAEFVEYFRGKPRGIDVVSRSRFARPFDVVYRPYQLIDPAELAWLTTAGKRLLTGQLDMIAFSIPTYHPSPALFHAVRNLQRRVLRLADGVTFISEFGHQATLAECPDLDPRRLFVVSCGTEGTMPPQVEPPRAETDLDLPDDFVLCLSATFAHKNRPHALRVYERLCEQYDFEGALLIAGPEPFYGRSTDAEAELIAAMSPSLRSRVRRLGQLDQMTKWSVLQRARLVLYPSVVEGFGLIPFEAAAAGTPCLAYAGSALGELLAGTPCLIDTWSVDEWARVAHDAIAEDERRAAIVSAVRSAASAHTWDQVAIRTWSAIDAVAALPRAAWWSEEGGLGSRVSPPNRPLSTGARASNLAHRAVARAGRRIHSSSTSPNE
jgi:glycosyltransferase involved in cell wall biosynthesis